MKKLLILVGLLLVVGSLLFAGANAETKPQETKTITMWCAYSQPDRIIAMDSAIAQFEELNPNIKVVRELVPWSNIRQKWIASKMAGTLPQMVVGGDADLIPIWAAGDFEPVDDVVEMVGGKDAFLPGPLNGLTIDGKVIALPHYTLSWKMAVRTDWLEELGLPIPKTWDEFAEAAIAITNPPQRYGFDLPLSKSAYKSKEWLAYFMRTNGAEFFNEKGEVNFNTPQTIETVRFLVDLYKQTGRQAALNYSENDAIDNFVKGNVGFIFAAGSLVKAIVNTNPDLLDKIAIIETPMNTKPPVDGAGLVGIGKFKGVAHSEETSKFMAFLLKQDIYREFLFSMPNMVPITVEGSKDPKFWDDPRIADYSHLYGRFMEGAMNGARVGMDYGPTPVANSGITGSEIEDMFHSIIVDGVSVEQAVKATHEKIKAQLSAAGY
ncbi:sugar ABC transporter substrate-binding protein [uncultured Sphaerochaeta sp.]|uniref:ABC transporter substrate-binding protein n=1 Tax=uncultured Sphaerochaeta sp. TaxID=886478 RepID=UPI0029CA538B|nr:sugar ABC transporter substrate-binding protein [uncultured Sphaerochaeta sp.]